jgi:hypothetical protein
VRTFSHYLFFNTKLKIYFENIGRSVHSTVAEVTKGIKMSRIRKKRNY